MNTCVHQQNQSPHPSPGQIPETRGETLTNRPPGCRGAFRRLGSCRAPVRPGRRWVPPLALTAAASAVLALTCGCSTALREPPGNLHQTVAPKAFYLPNAEASQIVSVSTNQLAAVEIPVHTQRVAVKEGGPRETIERFGEVYAFVPSFFAVHRNEPTRIRFRNLQPDDHHGFMLMDPRGRVLMNLWLPPLEELSYVFTFHEEGLYRFVCSFHPTVMWGQLLVLPARVGE